MKTKLLALATTVVLAAFVAAPALADNNPGKIDPSQTATTPLELTKVWAAQQAAPPPAESATIADRLAWERGQEMLDKPGASTAELSREWLENNGLDGDVIPEGLSAYQYEILSNARELAGLPPLFTTMDDFSKWMVDHSSGSSATAQKDGAPVTSGGGDSTSSSGGSGTTDGTSLGDRAPDPTERHDPDPSPGGSGSSGSSGSSGNGSDDSQKYHVEDRQNEQTTAEGTKTVTQNADGGRTEVETKTNEDGTTSTTKTTYDKDGNVVDEQSHSSSTDAAGGTTTVDECKDDCLTTPEQDNTVYFAGPLGMSVGQFVTLHQQREQPSNVDDGSGGDAGPVDFTKLPYYGKVDPSPESDGRGVVLRGGVTMTFTITRPLNSAGPEFGPDGPQNTDTSGGLGPQGNGPISLQP